jgi:hypothetical protein
MSGGPGGKLIPVFFVLSALVSTLMSMLYPIGLTFALRTVKARLWFNRGAL